MKTIGFRDVAGGPVRLYENKSKPNQKRHDRVRDALNDLRHTGNIVVYLINGRKYRCLYFKGM